MEGLLQHIAGLFRSSLVTQSRVFKVLRYIRRLPVFPVFVLSTLVVTGVLANWVAPHNPRVGDLRERNTPPAWESEGSTTYLLGTDHLGRDILSRIIHGARFSLIVAGIALALGGTVGTLLGLVSGWYGGWVDELIMRLVDIKVALPTILVALVLVVALGQHYWVLIGVISLTIWPRFARMVRGEALDLKTHDYVALAKVAGASNSRIIFKHLLPGVANTLIVVASLEVGVVILLEATLSFLGAGVRPPTPAWGSMVSVGRDRIATAWWISTMPGIAIMLTVMSLNLLGDWLRDTLDPRLRQLK